MRIRNKKFFIAETVSRHNSCRLATEILQRGGLLTDHPGDKPDCVIYNADKSYDFQQFNSADHPVIRMTENEAISFFDTSMIQERCEFCVSSGVLVAWIPPVIPDQLLIIPEGIRRIGADAFSALHNENKSVYNRAKQCVNRIIFPKTLEVIECDAFRGFTDLRSVRFNRQLKEVSGFRGCKCLADAELPDSIEKIGDYAFSGCTLLTDFHFNEKITEIGCHAFERTGIETFSSWPSLKTIGAFAFSGCVKLKTVILRDSETECGKSAFRYCGVNHLQLENGKYILKSGCFKGCENLYDIHAENGKVEITSTVFPHKAAAAGIRKLKEDTCTETEKDMWMSMIKRYRRPFLKSMRDRMDTELYGFCEQIIKQNSITGITDPDPVRREALYRIELLIRQTGLNPNIRKYYKQGRLYYSYITGGGFIGSIDTISYNPRNEMIVKNTERMYGIHVYHAVESAYPWESLILLYVENDPGEREYGRPDHGYVMAYVHNFELGEGEFGYVGFSAYQGALYRTE